MREFDMPLKEVQEILDRKGHSYILWKSDRENIFVVFRHEALGKKYYIYHKTVYDDQNEIWGLQCDTTFDTQSEAVRYAEKIYDEPLDRTEEEY